MRTLVWSPEAIGDLQAIWDFIAEDNPRAATRVIDRIREAAERLPEFPRLGRPEHRRRLKHLNIAGTPYFLVYRARKMHIAIARVIRGARDWPPRRGRA